MTQLFVKLFFTCEYLFSISKYLLYTHQTSLTLQGILISDNYYADSHLGKAHISQNENEGRKIINAMKNHYWQSFANSSYVDHTYFEENATSEYISKFYYDLNLENVSLFFLSA